MCWVRQPNERKIFAIPIIFELSLVFRPNNQDNCISVQKFFMILAQLRQMRLAKWSDKAPVENQNNVLFFSESGKLILGEQTLPLTSLQSFYLCNLSDLIAI
jgi:hypothetical protein